MKKILTTGLLTVGLVVGPAGVALAQGIQQCFDWNGQKHCVGAQPA